MDSSNTSGMNRAHLQPQYHGNSSYSFINDIDSYTNDDSMQGSDDFSNFAWDPALFAGGDVGSGFSQQQQQQQPIQANLNQTLTRQSNSPALQPHHTAPSPYTQSNYGHSIYDHRNLAQPSFDERFMSRPSASPTSFEHHQAYQPMPYGNYSFQQQYGRQASPQTQFYAPRPIQQQPPPQQQQQQQQQPTQQMMNIPARQPSQLSQPQQPQQMDAMQMHQYQQQRMTHTFVNPSMLSSGHGISMNGTQQQNNSAAPRQQYQPSPYFQKPGSTVDPQALHTMQMQSYQQIAAAPPHMIQQSSTPQPLQPQLNQNQILSPPATSQQIPAIKAATQPRPAKDPNAPKKTKAKAKVKKDGTADTESSDELEIEDEPPEVKPALLVVSPPTDEKSKALYSAVEAVWYPRNRSPQAEDVRRGIAAFGEIVRSLRDAWKAKNDSLKKAELPNSPTAGEVPQLKDDVARYRQTMELVMQRSLQYGHDAIVKRLGENQFTLSALYSFLLDRHNVSDFDGTLVNSIFKFAVKFETLDEEMLEQVKWTKVLQRIAKRATSDSKTLAQKILTNAQINSERKKSTKLEGAPGSPSSVNGSKKGTVAGVKRSRDGEVAGIPAPRKLVKPASKPLALQSAERRKALEKESLQKTGLVKTEKGAVNPSTSVTSRPKVAMSAPPKANPLAGLSVSKKPGTSIAERAAAAAAAAKDKPAVPGAAVSNGLVSTVKKEETKKDSPPRTLGPSANKSTSSFLGFLADMDKPKETETKKVDVDPNETEEQRAKRLRKEDRRKLRVTWKPDNDLVQVKLFTHDPEEETGQTDNMMRDAGDTMKEGEMLKRHMAMEEVEDDEEEETSLEEFGEYTLPSEVDFSTLSDADRSANFFKYGGSQKPESTASDAQAKYEENTLMTTYTFQSDRPETPKELPSVNDDDDFQPVVDFGEPDDKVRSREREIHTRRQPQNPPVSQPGNTDLAAQLRALGMQQPQQQAPAFNPYSQPSITQPSAPPMASGIDLSKLLAVMQQAKQMQQAPPQQPTYQPSTTGIPANVAAILAQVSGQQNQSLPLGNAGNPNPFPGNEDQNRKHGRGDDGAESSSKKKKKAADGKPYNYKTITCSFWQEGKCTKGDSCTYKHEL